MQDAKLFIAKCLGPPEDRPAVGQLLEDRFFCRKPAPPRPPSITGDDGSGLAGRDGSVIGDEQRGGGGGAGCVCLQHSVSSHSCFMSLLLHPEVCQGSITRHNRHGVSQWS